MLTSKYVCLTVFMSCVRSRSYQSEKNVLKKFQLYSKYIFLLGNDPYIEILGNKIYVTRLIFVLCQKMYFVLKNSSMKLVHFWEIGLITRRFGRIHTWVYELNILTILIPMSKSELILKLKFYYNGLTAKHVGQLQLCVSHMQLAILILS
jgi:hypothetical protein